MRCEELMRQRNKNLSTSKLWTIRWNKKKFREILKKWSDEKNKRWWQIMQYMLKQWPIKQNNNISIYKISLEITMINKWFMHQLCRKMISLVMMRFRDEETKKCLQKIEKLPLKEWMIFRDTGLDLQTLYSIMSMWSKSKKISKNSKKKHIWDISKQRKTSKTLMQTSITSFIQILTRKWKTDSRSTLITSFQRFKKKEKNFKDRKMKFRENSKLSTID